MNDRKPIGLTVPYRAPTPEDEEFNRIERESRIKQDYVRDIKKPSREALIAEVAVLTELVRVLSGKVDSLHAMYEQASKQRDELMDQQRAQVEAMRGKMQ
jgi:hypothetical protein